MRETTADVAKHSEPKGILVDLFGRAYEHVVSSQAVNPTLRGVSNHPARTWKAIGFYPFFRFYGRPAPFYGKK
jgi:hypothetical protein